MRSNLTFLLLLLFGTICLNAQKIENLQKATLIQSADYMIEVSSISTQIANGEFIPAEDINKEVNPKKRSANKAVPGKGLPNGNDPLWQKEMLAFLLFYLPQSILNQDQSDAQVFHI
jgi:hypothetical protein